jgi:hypothetical protein
VSRVTGRSCGKTQARGDARKASAEALGLFGPIAPSLRRPNKTVPVGGIQKAQGHPHSPFSGPFPTALTPTTGRFYFQANHNYPLLPALGAYRAATVSAPLGR